MAAEVQGRRRARPQRARCAPEVGNGLLALAFDGPSRMSTSGTGITAWRLRRGSRFGDLYMYGREGT